MTGCGNSNVELSQPVVLPYKSSEREQSFIRFIELFAYFTWIVPLI